MSELTEGLRGDLRTEYGKHISSGFAYWGIGPIIAWSNACNDVCSTR
jgi:L-histidine N-alpha-methyltransferase